MDKPFVQKLLPLGGVGLALLFLIYTLSSSITPLDRSLLGLGGLVDVLKRNEVDVRIVGNDVRLKSDDEATLRVFPLYSPLSRRRPDQSNENHERQSNLRPLGYSVLSNKVKRLPTLIVLPKWVNGVRKHGEIHPDLLIDTVILPHLQGEAMKKAGLQRSAVWGEPRRLQVFGNELTDFRGRFITLHSPQTLSRLTPRCIPLLGVEGRMILGRCRYPNFVRNKGGTYLLLTDPDVLNNLGLTFGDNAELARDLVIALAGDRKVILDTSTRLIVQGAKSKPSRSFADLYRFFQPPFTSFWMVLGLFLLFLLWHSWRRSGPVQRSNLYGLDDAQSASKRTSIEADAALLRARNRQEDAKALACLHMNQRLDDLAFQMGNLSSESVGQTKGRVASQKALLERLRRVAPERYAEILDMQNALNRNHVGNADKLVSFMNQFQNLINGLNPRNPASRPTKPQNASKLSKESERL